MLKLCKMLHFIENFFIKFLYTLWENLFVKAVWRCYDMVWNNSPKKVKFWNVLFPNTGMDLWLLFTASFISCSSVTWSTDRFTAIISYIQYLMTGFHFVSSLSFLICCGFHTWSWLWFILYFLTKTNMNTISWHLILWWEWLFSWLFPMFIQMLSTYVRPNFQETISSQI